jgi:hypothetical protein
MATRRSTRNPTPTARFSPPQSASRPTRTRVSTLSLEPENQMDLEPSSSSALDSNRIATGTLTPIDSNSLVTGKLYSIWHKAEKTEDITDPVVGVEAGQRDSKDKYYTRFKGKFVGYDRGLSSGYPDGITGIPPVTELAVFEEVRIISKDKKFFTRDIYLIGKQANNPNIKTGFDVSTYQQALNPALIAPPPVNHPLFKRYFDRHIANGKGRVAFDMDYWSFANDIATLSNKLDRERAMAYNDFSLNAFANPADPNLVNTRKAMGEIGPNTLVAEYLGKDTKIPKTIPLDDLPVRGESFNPYVYEEQRMSEVDGGAKRKKTRRRKTRRNKTRRNKTRSKRRRSTRSRK